MILVLNMMDSARAQGLRIDTAALSRELGVPVVGVVATTGEGIAELKDTILEAAARRPIPVLRLAYPAAVETALTRIAAEVESVAKSNNWPPRWLALKLFENDPALKTMVPASVAAAV